MLGRNSAGRAGGLRVAANFLRGDNLPSTPFGQKFWLCFHSEMSRIDKTRIAEALLAALGWARLGISDPRPWMREAAAIELANEILTQFDSVTIGAPLAVLARRWVKAGNAQCFTGEDWQIPAPALIVVRNKPRAAGKDCEDRVIG